MSARASAYVIKDVPCDGGESPNAFVPRITVEVRVHYPPNTVSHQQVQEALDEAYDDASQTLKKRVWWRP